ncbi:MAG: cytochrome b/b6 domain-containing protein [Candidatus Nitricoxidivorans perseverans]|uniref:Cytochrome b/b6 domain-containing protein n=1 Tax=Candidatus Nitricoxidivorans perseverans TaxID=2975601 RepID=A0AA49FMJ8_9PROT|nr:MAG: cytochrome b/b6 domain-containing protein [Candidatus Nitricoxidivorans perseverans]
MATTKIYVFNRFNRFWHWGQALLVLTMLTTGFEIHGAYALFGFEKAVGYHTIAAWSLISLWAFAIFWQFTTGEWKQYIPTLEKVDAMVKYYVTGIFTHAPHPFRLTQLHKHNPLQRIAYLTILSIVGPLVWSTGLLYIFHDYWTEWGLRAYVTLEWVAFFHTMAAFMMLAFLIIHVYLITTGHTIGAHLKAMITGWEEVEAD